MNFSNIKEWTITEGSVKQVTDSNGIVLWKKQGGHDYSQDYFFVEDASGSANTLTIKKNYAASPSVTIYKSTDQINWESMGSTTTSGITATVPANGKLYLKATTNALCIFDDNYDKANIISCSGNYNIGGNIMSLLKNNNFYNTTLNENVNTRAFCRLFFHSSTLINSVNLILPSNVCRYCYRSMFNGCTSLTTAPVLPATTLTSGCYSGMFAGCTSLTTAPVLPATTLISYCYYNMFDSCSNLNNVTTYANDISATDCLQLWLRNVAASGDFYNLGSATYPSGASGIPTGWIEVHN